MSLKLLKRPQTLILAWDETEKMWFRYRPAGIFHTRLTAERWIKKNTDLDGLMYLAVPNNEAVLKSLEGIC